MATTLSVLLRKKFLKDGTSPIALRITKNRKSFPIHFGNSIHPKFWQESYPWVKTSFKNSKWLNNLLLDRLTKANKEILQLEAERPDVSIDELKNIVKRIIEGKSAIPETPPKPLKPNPTVFEFAKDYLSIFEDSGDYERYRTEKAPVNHLKKFMGEKDLYFSDITVLFLKKFKAYLKGSCDLGERTAVNNLIIIRTLFKLAIEEEIIEAKAYPFGKGKIRCKRPQSMKIGFEENELLQIERVILPTDHPAYHPRNIWLLSYYFAGIRGSDTLKLRWDRFKNGRLYYSMNKNQKSDSFKIPEKAQKILNIYKKPDSKTTDLIFPFLIDPIDFLDKKTTQNACKRELQRIGRGLLILEVMLGLEKRLSMNVSRHSFATIAGDKIPMPMLQRLYRHSDISTTINYMAAFMRKDLDDALDKVLNFSSKTK